MARLCNLPRWNTRIALEFFQQHLPFTEMMPADDLVTGGEVWCLAAPGKVCAVYAWVFDDVHLRLPEGRYRVSRHNPRQGGPLLDGHEVSGPGLVALGQPP